MASPERNGAAENESLKVQSATASRPASSSSKRQYSGKKESMNGPLYMQTCNKTVLVRRLKRKGDGPTKQLARWFVENQIGFSFNLLALLFCAHKLFPKAHPHTTKFFALSYYNEESGRYAAGFEDAYLVAFCVVLFTGLRAATMEYVLAPFAKYMGIEKKKDVTRFSEQAWVLIYYCVFWTFGFYVYYQSSYWMSFSKLWANWPDREQDGILKLYVLAQLAFWFQQVFVINIEERRKDHWQMLSHHIVTITLITASYRYHMNPVGNLILVLFDVGDLFLSGAKCLKYMGFTTVCDVAFGVFMFAWLICRHVLYLMTCWSIYNESAVIIPQACFSGTNANLTGPIETPKGFSHWIEPFLRNDGLVCYDDRIKWAFLSFLLVLQALTIVWFFMIVRVAIRVLQGKSADDIRSDDEGDGMEDEEEFVYEEAQPLEEEVGVEQLDLKSWERRSGVKRQATTASGVSLPGHSDRKELLGRIGCEKQVD